jgi:hypothetical protein
MKPLPLVSIESVEWVEVGELFKVITTVEWPPAGTLYLAPYNPESWAVEVFEFDPEAKADRVVARFYNWTGSTREIRVALATDLAEEFVDQHNLWLEEDEDNRSAAYYAEDCCPAEDEEELGPIYVEGYEDWEYWPRTEV